MKNLAHLSAIFLLATIAVGCAPKYGCKGLPEDPACLSAVEAYQATDKANTTVRSKEPKSVADKESNRPSHAANPPADFFNPVPAPKIEDPTPIRTPSKVMRIWVAPWEDSDGDLNVSGYLFTELEPRRWMVGKAAPSAATSLKPLQVIHREKDKKHPSSNADTATMNPTGIDDSRTDSMVGTPLDR